MKEATKKVILRLKEVRVQKNMSYQDVVDACEALGVPISMSTVRRFFSKNNEDGSEFRTYTIDAIFRAVIGTEDAPAASDIADADKEIAAENAALKAVVELRDAVIDGLRQQIADLTEANNSLQEQMNVLEIRLNTTTELFKIGMEALGKGVGK